MYVYLHRRRGKGVNQWLLHKGFDPVLSYGEILDLFMGKTTGRQMRS